MAQTFVQNEPLAIDIEATTIQNKNYRQVLYTGKMQLVVMSLLPGEEIGFEIHSDHDQFIRIESGTGQGEITGTKYELKDGSILMIPAGYRHNVINTGNTDLKLYTIYSPPEHKPNTIQQNKPN